MKNRRIFFTIFMLAMALSVVLSWQGVLRAEGQGAVVVVRIKNLGFDPTDITIRPGTTVRWVNEDPFSHDVTSGTVVSGRRARQVAKSRTPDGRFHSGAYGQGKTYERRFDKTGEYPYFCTIHPIMTGVVRVVK